METRTLLSAGMWDISLCKLPFIQQVCKQKGSGAVNWILNLNKWVDKCRLFGTDDLFLNWQSISLFHLKCMDHVHKLTILNTVNWDCLAHDLFLQFSCFKQNCKIRTHEIKTGSRHPNSNLRHAKLPNTTKMLDQNHAKLIQFTVLLLILISWPCLPNVVMSYQHPMQKTEPCPASGLSAVNSWYTLKKVSIVQMSYSVCWYSSNCLYVAFLELWSLLLWLLGGDAL